MDDRDNLVGWNNGDSKMGWRQFGEVMEAWDRNDSNSRME